MPAKLKLANNADCRGEIHALRRADTADDVGAELSDSERTALLAEVRGNPSTTRKVVVVATTYLQGEEPNHNFIRFRDGALGKIARSFKGAPFLRDHAQRDFLARGGTIVDSELVELSSGRKAFRQTVELVKPWAVEAALDGTLDRFSIGWRPTGPINCTICGEAYERGFFGVFPSCDHELGKTYEVKKADRICEAEFSAAEGVELSGVSVPAVDDTSVDEIREALAALDPAFPQWAARSALPNKEQPMNLAAIAIALGLAGTVDESTVLAEIGRRETLLEAERRGRADAEARLAAAQERESTARREAVMARALREGKVRPNSPLAEKLAALSATSIDMAEALVTDLPRIQPVGAPLLSSQPAPAGGRGAETSAESLTDEEQAVMAQLNAGGAGLTPAAMVKARSMAAPQLPAALARGERG